MRAIPPALLATIVAQQATLCTLWRVQRQDGAVLTLTDHDRAIVLGGDTYAAAIGYSASALRQAAGLAPANLDIDGVLDSTAIDEADLLAGRWDHAAVRVSLIDWSNPAGGSLLLRSGRMGKVETRDSAFVAELLGLAQAFETTIGEIYQPGCRATLGDARCGVALGPLTVTGTLDADATDRRTLVDAARGEAAGHFDFGLVTFTSGLNAGLGMEVKSYTPGSIELQLPLPYPVAAGDSYSLVPGCDGLFETCRVRFANQNNFRGEPHVPGTDRIMRFGGQ